MFHDLASGVRQDAKQEIGNCELAAADRSDDAGDQEAETKRSEHRPCHDAGHAESVEQVVDRMVAP